jgi:hypothetical protein
MQSVGSTAAIKSEVMPWVQERLQCKIVHDSWVVISDFIFYGKIAKQRKEER